MTLPSFAFTYSMNSWRFFEGVAIFAMRSCGFVQIIPTGSRSLSTSNCTGWMASTITCVPMWPMPTVYPSGAERASLFTAMLPPAPVTFSTMICCPNAFPMRSPMIRAMVSVGPPTAKGTIIVVG